MAVDVWFSWMPRLRRRTTPSDGWGQGQPHIPKRGEENPVFRERGVLTQWALPDASHPTPSWDPQAATDHHVAADGRYRPMADHQHGFRKGRSTTTVLYEIDSFLSSFTLRHFFMAWKKVLSKSSEV